MCKIRHNTVKYVDCLVRNVYFLQWVYKITMFIYKEVVMLDSEAVVMLSERYLSIV